MYERRVYRGWSGRSSLKSFEVLKDQSDLHIQAGRELTGEALCSLLSIRRDLEFWIDHDPRFAGSLRPLDSASGAPEIVREMTAAAVEWDVGPMAAVAGAVAERVGRDLLDHTSEVIVENGGDIFARCTDPLRLSVYPGERSPFNGRILFETDAKCGIGVCTSSGVVGPSFSFGRADAVTAVASSAARADAAATAIANRIRCGADVAPQVEWAAKRGGLTGVIACCEDSMCVWGELELLEK